MARRCRSRTAIGRQHQLAVKVGNWTRLNVRNWRELTDQAGPRPATISIRGRRSEVRARVGGPGEHLDPQVGEVLGGTFFGLVRLSFFMAPMGTQDGSRDSLAARRGHVGMLGIPRVR